MHRKGPRFTRILAACAAVPVIFTAAACSSDSGSGSDSADSGSKSESSAESSASPGKDEAATVAKAAFDTLPDACKALKGDTIEDLVPKVDEKSGKSGSSKDTATRGSCSWTGLDSNGTKGSQYRWLSIGLMRYDSNATLGSGDKLAKDQLAKKVEEAKALEGAKNTVTRSVTGIGDEATLVVSDLKKKEGDFKNHRVVARVENAVVVLDYNGAGLAGAGDPDSKKMANDAQDAAKEAVAAVKDANKPGGKATGKAEDKSDSDKGDSDKAGSDKGEDKADASGSDDDADGPKKKTSSSAKH